MAQPPASAPEPSHELPAGERLDSWKEIAAYLKRDVRTVQIWEKEEALPVHRHMHKGRASVYAYKSQLEAWWNNRRPKLEAEEAKQQLVPGSRRRILWAASLGAAILVALTAWYFRGPLGKLPSILGSSSARRPPEGAPAAQPYTPHFWVLTVPAGEGPEPRVSARAIYNPGSGRMVVFGGYETEFFNDVWVLLNAGRRAGKPEWKKLRPRGPAPPRRMSHSLVHDPASNRIVLFGGRNGAEYFNDLWVLTHADGTGGTPQWMELSASGAPPAPRSGHSATFDVRTNSMIVYGGLSTTPSVFLSDVWVLEGANGLKGVPRWRLLRSEGPGPGPRHEHGAAYDPASNRLIVYGGFTVPAWSEPAVHEVWVLTNANGQGGLSAWIKLQPAGRRPRERARHSMFYLPAKNQLFVAFGNSDSDRFNDVWLLTHANGLGGAPRWVPLNPPEARPVERCCQAAAWDSSTESLMVFGGQGLTQVFDDVWLLTANSDIPEEFTDSFDAAELDPAWQVLRGAGSYSLTENPGHLRYRVSGSHAQPRVLHLLRQFQGHSWTLEGRVAYFTGASGGGRGLDLRVYFGVVPLPYKDSHPPSVTVARVRDDWTGCCPGEIRVIFEDHRAGYIQTNYVIALNRADTYVFRIHRRGHELSVEASEDGIQFRRVGSYAFGPQIDGVAQFLDLAGNSFADFDSFADYDYVRLTKQTPHRIVP